MARKVIICDKNAGASGGGHGLKTVILSVYRFISLLVYRFIASQAPTPKSRKRTCNH